MFVDVLCAVDGGRRRTETAATRTQQNRGHQVSVEETREDGEFGASECNHFVLLNTILCLKKSGRCLRTIEYCNTQCCSPKKKKRVYYEL